MIVRLDKKAVKLILPSNSHYNGDSYVYMSANIAVIENGTIKYTPDVKNIAGALTPDHRKQWQSFKSDELEKKCNVESEDVFYCPDLTGCHSLIIKSRISGEYWVAHINPNQAFPKSTNPRDYTDEYSFLMASSFFNHPENAYAAFFAMDNSKIPENDEIDVVCIGDSFNKNMFIRKCGEKNITIKTLRTLSVGDHFNVVVGSTLSRVELTSSSGKSLESSAKAIHIAFLPESDKIVIYSDEFKKTDFTRAIPAVHVAGDVFAHPEINLHFHYLFNTYLGSVTDLFQDQTKFMQDLVLFSNRFPIIQETPRLVFLYESCPDNLLRTHACQTKDEFAYKLKIDLKSKQHNADEFGCGREEKISIDF